MRLRENGYSSNYSCYVQSVDEKGSITYDTHALGCSICVDITQDNDAIIEAGKTVSDIKAIVDQMYSNMSIQYSLSQD